MATEINEFQASLQSLKSIQNRIEMAKRGIPVAGRLPPGRTFDKKTDCKHFSKVSATFIEDGVMVHLFTFFGNKSAMEEAIKSAVPDYSDIEKLKIHKIEMHHRKHL